jgi:hypothetical protein
VFENLLFSNQMKKLAAILILAFATLSLGQNSRNTRFMGVDELRPGMKGTGKTVFEGTTITEFQAEIMGVLKNVAPKQDLILARLSGGPLEKTGVISGMSGSPVYIDGRLIGAVAYSFPFAKDPIAGIQPIGQMIDVLDPRGIALTRVAAVSADSIVPAQMPAAFVYSLIEKVRSGASIQEALAYPIVPASVSGGSLAHIQTPLSISGVTPAAMQQFAPFFSSYGFSAVQSGASGGASLLPSSPSKRLEPGSAVSAELVSGDLDISANGTVTYVDGDRVYAFGHPFLSAGPLDLPMTNAYIVSSLAKLDNSTKVAVPVDVVGAFRQDRATGILGSMAEKPSTIPLTITVKAGSASVPYKLQVVNDRYLTPLLTALSIINAITASERGIGEITLSVNGKIQLKNSEPVNISNISTGDGNGPTTAAMAAIAPLQYLLASGFDSGLVEKMDLEVVTSDRKTSATLEQISVDRNEAKPGEKITLTALLRGTRGETFIEQYPVTIPTGLPAGRIQIFVGDGSTITASELKRGATGAPPGLAAAVRELNKLRKNDRLYVKIVSNEPGVVISGEELPSLPPSMIALLDTNRASTRSVAPLSNSTVSEYELPQSKYVLQGQRSLSLNIKP